jgi:glycyl-tRNA synthetase beta chain
VAEKVTTSLILARDYNGVLQVLGQLSGPIDSFFKAVMVMAEDPDIRANRLSLLKRILSLAAPLVDLSKIVI